MLKVLRNDEHEPLAMFELEDDGSVTATYVRPMVKDDIETYGLLYKGKVLRPKDGKDFMDALDIAYSNSSRLYVHTVD